MDAHSSEEPAEKKSFWARIGKSYASARSKFSSISEFYRANKGEFKDYFLKNIENKSVLENKDDLPKIKFFKNSVASAADTGLSIWALAILNEISNPEALYKIKQFSDALTRDFSLEIAQRVGLDFAQNDLASAATDTEVVCRGLAIFSSEILRSAAAGLRYYKNKEEKKIPQEPEVQPAVIQKKQRLR